MVPRALCRSSRLSGVSGHGAVCPDSPDSRHRTLACGGVNTIGAIFPLCSPGAVSPVVLWLHQERALAAIWQAVRARLSAGLIVLPTGAGKTVTFLAFARDQGQPALVLVHRDELVQQTVRTVGRVWPEARVGVIQGPRSEWQEGQDLVVASVQSLHPRRLARMPQDRFGLLVVDEAHHTPAQSYLAIWGHFQVAFRLGVTATPKRLDGQGLAEWYGPEALYTYSIRRAIADGVLVDVQQFQIETGVSLDGVPTKGGDFAKQGLSRAVNTPIRNAAVVDAYLEHASDRRAIAFAVDLPHVAALAEAFREAGVSTATVSGKTPLPVRRQTLADFAAGAYRVLVNCQVATEGFDDPGVSCILMARPTCSEALYVQCAGRGLRRCDATGKRDCLILDITDNCRRHKLVTSSSLLGKEPSEGTGEEPAEGGGSERQQAPKHDSAPVVWRLEAVSPWPELPNLSGYRAACPWHGEPASDGQLRYLRSFGLDITRALTKGEASYLLDQAIRYEQEFPTPATPRQERFLRLAGQWVEGLSKREASSLIDELKGTARN